MIRNLTFTQSNYQEMDNITLLAKAFAEDVMTITADIMASSMLVNDKVGRNTIAPNSDIFKQMYAKASGNIVIQLLLNDYVQYIESGRKAGSKFPPIQPIVQWAKKRGIPTDNSTIFLIRRAIAEDGIRPRPFMYKVLETIDKKWDGEWSSELFNELTKIIDEFFNK